MFVWAYLLKVKIDILFMTYIIITAPFSDLNELNTIIEKHPDKLSPAALIVLK